MMVAWSFLRVIPPRKILDILVTVEKKEKDRFKEGSSVLAVYKRK
jgi:hypothetical protein